MGAAMPCLVNYMVFQHLSTAALFRSRCSITGVCPTDIPIKTKRDGDRLLTSTTISALIRDGPTGRVYWATF